MCLQIIYIQYISINRIWHLITYNDWYAIKPNQPINVSKIEGRFLELPSSSIIIDLFHNKNKLEQNMSKKNIPSKNILNFVWIYT